MTHGRYYCLDMMRGVAAILVVVYHLGMAKTQLAPSGIAAVDFFFILSGFVVDRAYAGKLREGMKFGEFMLLRLIRLYPLFLVGILIGLCRGSGAAALSAPGARPMSEILGSLGFNLLMLPSPFSNELFQLNAPGWSLFLELLINALFAVLLVGVGTRLLLATVIISAGGMIYTALLWDTLNIGWGWPTFMGGIFRVGFGFPLGMLISRWLTNPPRVTPAAAVLPVLLVVALASPGHNYLGTYYDLLCAMLVSPILVLAGARYEFPVSLNGPAAMLGNISYPLYAVHLPAISIFAFVSGKIGLGGLPSMAVFLALLLLSSVILDRHFDRPIRKFLTRLFSRRSMARPDAAISK
jgi:peptidoglycan/LPS O-acetylase OafA/YrhL